MSIPFVRRFRKLSDNINLSKSYNKSGHTHFTWLYLRKGKIVYVSTPNLDIPPCPPSFFFIFREVVIFIMNHIKALTMVHDWYYNLPEPEKLKTLQRADFSVKTFQTTKKCANSNFATKIVRKYFFATKVHDWNIKGEQTKNKAT